MPQRISNRKAPRKHTLSTQDLRAIAGDVEISVVLHNYAAIDPRVIG
jgi:hypothetical protein